MKKLAGKEPTIRAVAKVAVAAGRITYRNPRSSHTTSVPSANITAGGMVAIQKVVTQVPASPAAEMRRKGGKACAEGMTPERRAEIAKAAAAKRWAT